MLIIQRKRKVKIKSEFLFFVIIYNELSLNSDWWSMTLKII